MHCVIGSGPSGVACAQALLDQGVPVRMLDAGVSLEQERSQAVEKAAAATPADWPPQLIAFLKGKMASNVKGIPLKLVFGSDFPYQDVERHIPCALDGVGIRPSLAQGGLSNVWGAAMLPYIDSDMPDWPFGAARLDRHYREVIKLTGIAGRQDDLASTFPLYAADPGQLQLSSQARTLLGRLDRNRAALRRAGIQHGTARIAVRAPRPDAAGCIYCRMCMYGCPYGHIYNSVSTLNDLKRNPKFTYQPDTIVKTLEETPRGVAIRTVHRHSGISAVFEVERVFLAAGVIPTTRILLESKKDHGRSVWMRDSQYYLVPLLQMRRIRDVRQESLHTLSQLFLEILDPAISRFGVHLQIYSYNDLISPAIAQAFVKLGLKSDSLVRQLEERLMVAQGYLHSDLSSRIRVTLREGVDGAPARLELSPEINPETRAAVKRVIFKLLRNARQLGAVPLLPMLQIAEPGRSFHTGGTFPMRLRPGPFESDPLGRPHGWLRVHAVDATVLPSVPATTITLSVMANAHRIGFEAAQLSATSPAPDLQSEPRQRTCLLTGAKGYLGGCVKAQFEAHGWKVIQLVRNPSPAEVAAGRALPFCLGEELEAGKIGPADALVHCAYDFKARDWEDIRRINVQGSQLLFNSASKAGVPRLVFISTMSAFTGCKSLYGRAKLEIEAALPPGALVLRPGLIHGDSPRGMFGNLVAQVSKSNRVPIFGDGGQVLYLSHQEDLCRVILDFADHRMPAIDEPIIAAHDQSWTFKQILNEIARAKGRQIKFLRLPWRLVWLGIKSFELLHVPLNFRSDSLISLMNQDAAPSFAATHKAGLKFRIFDAGKLKL